MPPGCANASLFTAPGAATPDERRAIMPNLLGGAFHQIAYVTGDFEQALDVWRSRRGQITPSAASAAISASLRPSSSASTAWVCSPNIGGAR